MQLIAPQSNPRRTLRPGDVVVFNDNAAAIVSFDIDDGPGKLRLTWLDEGLITIAKTADEWLEYFQKELNPYTIYSADEWALKLVPKELSHE
jgi:hypothetical protein